MNKKSLSKRILVIYVLGIVLCVAFLLAGPLFINYMFITETVNWHVNLAFSAGEMLQYYGAILGGIVMGLAILSTIHINNINIKQYRKRLQFERAYEIYHKLPDNLTKLESAAIHVQYLVHMNESKLVETIDTMKESEDFLREQHFVNDYFYNKNIDSLMKKIIAVSTKCQENVESFLKAKEAEGKDLTSSQKSMEDAFVELRETIAAAKSEIMAEVNKFVFDNKEF